MTSTTVTNDFTYILARSPIGTEGQAYDSLLTNGIYNANTLAQALANSTEAQNYVDPIVLLYETSFGHVPDNAGLQFWTGLFEQTALGGASKVTANALAAAVTTANGATTAQVAAYNNALVSVANSFVSVLIQNNFGGVTPSNTAFVQYLYQNLLGHAADASGLAYWVNALSTQSMGSVLANFVAVANTQAANITAIQNWQIASGTTGTPPATIAIGANGTGSTYTLTTGLDTLTGTSGNDTFNASVGVSVPAGGVAGSLDTLNAFDSIDGGTGTNTLNITDFATGTAMALPATATIKNIAVVNVQSGEAVGGALATPADFSTWTGLTALNVTQSKGFDSVKVAGTTAVNITDTAGNVAVVGGSTVTVATDAASAVGVVGTAGATKSVAVTGAGTVLVVDGNSSTAVLAGAVNAAHAAPATATANTITTVSATGATAVTVDSDALTTLNLTGVTGHVAPAATVNAAVGTRALTVNLTNTTGASVTDATATSLTVNATGVKSTGLTVTAAAATSLTLGGDQSLTTNPVTAGLATSAKIVGAGGVTTDLTGLAANAAVDASGSTGSNTVTLAATETYVGGSGSDTVKLSAVPTVSIDGGAGANTLSLDAIADLSTLNAAALAKATNFQTLQLTGAVGTALTAAKGTLDVSGLGAGFTGVTLNTSTDTEALTFKNAASGFSFTELGSQAFGSTISLKTDGTADILNLTLGNSKSALLDEATGGGITATTFETVNVVANADTSAGAVTHKLLLNDATATTLNISGNAGVDFTGSTLTAVKTIDAHTATGNITLVASGVTTGVTITTGSGDDVIVGSAAAKVGATPAGVDIISAGDGNNTITDAHGNNVITAGNGSNAITAGDGNNTITTGTIKAGSASTISVSGGNNIITSGDVAGTGHMTVTETAGAGNNTIHLGDGAADSVTVLNGNNSITIGAGAADIVTAGNGNNTIIAGNGGDTITVGNGNNTITAGTGVDLIKVGSGLNTVTTGGGVNATTGAADVVEFTVANQNVNTYTTINDFTTKGETLKFDVGAAGLIKGANITSDLNAGTAVFQDYANYAVHNSAVNTVDWFTYKGDTYVVVNESASGSFVNGTDVIVKLVGTVDLSTATFGGGALGGTIVHA